MFEIRPMTVDDWPSVADIYQQALDGRQATFQTEVPSWEDFDAAHHDFGRLVGCRQTEMLGWVALLPTSSRLVYQGVAEFSIYLANKAQGQGLGKQLMLALIEQSDANGIWTLQASTFPENVASLKLQESIGFRILGRRERIAQLDGVWRDTVLTERRSSKI